MKEKLKEALTLCMEVVPYVLVESSCEQESHVMCCIDGVMEQSGHVTAAYVSVCIKEYDGYIQSAKRQVS